MKDVGTSVPEDFETICSEEIERIFYGDDE
jgi:hypothetical protein